MRGLQVSLNGTVLYTAGVGDFGILQAGVESARIAQTRGTIYEHLRVEGKVMSGMPLVVKHFQNHPLELGDEVTIKVVEIDVPTEPLPGMPDFPRTVTRP